jgi:uncharacterized repeat protein (TIGR01451 family)
LDSNLPVTIQHASEENRVAGRYIVLFKSAVADPEWEAKDIEVHTGGKLYHTYAHAVKGFSATLTPEAVEKLRHDPRVAMIEEDRKAQATSTMPPMFFALPLPTSPQFPVNWYLDRIDQRNLPLDNSFSFPSNAGEGVHIYLLDTGILGGINGLAGAGSHVEFVGRVGNGIVFDAPALDGTPVVGGDGSDCTGHGTFGASLLAGTTLGVAKLATLHPVRVICGGGSAEAIAGVNWITSEHLAHPGQKSIANAPFFIQGGPDPALDLAVQNSINAGVVYVISAGNQGPAGVHFDFVSGLDTGNACNTSPQRVGAALTVGAMGGVDGNSLPLGSPLPFKGFNNFISDTIPNFSDTGGCVDLYAPGVGMTGADYASTTAITGPPTPHHGTSWSAPVTSGVVALFLAANPTASPAQVASAINNNATQNLLVFADVGFGGPNRMLYSDFQTDLQTVGSSNQGGPLVGAQFTYTYQVHNNGPYNTMDPVIFTDTLPGSVSLVGVNAASPVACSGVATITCDVGRLAVGQHSVIAITVKATAPGTIANSATATLQSGQTDRAPANNTATVTVTAK